MIETIFDILIEKIEEKINNLYFWNSILINKFFSFEINFERLNNDCYIFK